ncbi:MAG: glycosyltransferase [Rhodobacteraceae bacterium]|nr:glycosyltransferase [Paracoccaceae bacterium]MCZ8085544.1 glycosyltransferase [Paracoccaceae bacterium]
MNFLGFLDMPRLGTLLANKVLRGLALVSEPFSKRRAERFRRSAQKRDPHRLRVSITYENLDVIFRSGDTKAGPVKDEARARRVLIADYRLPRPDLSAGEKATFGLVSDLRALGFEVTFVPLDMENVSPYREALEALGVTVVTRDSGIHYGGEYIRTKGARFGVFYFIRVDIGEALLPSARLVAPDARMIFHSPDLHFLREGRAAELGGKLRDELAVARIKARETALMRAADHVVLVSPAEIPFVSDIVPRSKISVFPALYSPIIQSPAGYAARRDIFFLGGFKHPPNVDSVKSFVENVWPAVHAQLPDVEFHIIGAEAPEDVVALGAQPGVRFIGYVPDLAPVLSGYRISVAPLLYGAGIKGKLGAAMGAGVPSVTTTIGAEGMSIVDGVHALVCDAPDAFAEAITRLYSDEALWLRIAQKGWRLVEDRFGNAANQAAFFRVLEAAGALPLGLYVEHCKTVSPSLLPDPDPVEDVDVSVIVSVHGPSSLTQLCLNSVILALRGTGIVCEVILADDGSTEATEQLASVFPGLRVVRQDASCGSFDSTNAAANVARGKALLFLDNDTIVLPGWLVELVKVLEEEPQAAIVGSKVLSLGGTIHEAGRVLFSDATTALIGHGKLQNEPLHAFDREVDEVSFASLLVRRDFWNRQGGFDGNLARRDCRDLNFGMAARASGMQVICAAGSQVLRYGLRLDATEAERAPPPTEAAILQPRIEMWRDQLENDHLPPSTQIEIAASHAERIPFTKARERRKAGSLNILYFSPFPSHPDNHGNQATIQAFGRRFKQMGHKVHFALLQSGMYDSKSVKDMQSAWDSFHILPNNRQLRADGREIPFDDWYQPGLGENVQLLCNLNDIDVVFCSYVFQSKLLEFVPAHILKVIDTHDKMGNRYDMLRRNGQPLEFFSCSPEEEGSYLRRADIVVARRAEEAEYFNSVSQKKTAVVIPHFEEPMFVSRSFERLSNVGLVASANRINLAIVLDFLRTLEAGMAGRNPPFHVHIAGQVRDMIRDLPKKDQAVFSTKWLTLHGFVPKIADFYEMVDLVVSPVSMGTGINVKTVQAMAYGMPLVTTSWGCKGIETGDPLHSFASINDLVLALLELHDAPSELDRLARLSRERYQRFYADSVASFSQATRPP